MNKMREQFESVAKHHYWLRDIDSSWDEDCYSEPEWQLAWEMWKASREHLVIELPVAPSVAMYSTAYEADAAREAHFRVVDAIEEQGVKCE